MPRKKEVHKPRCLKLRLHGKVLDRYKKLHAQKVAEGPPNSQHQIFGVLAERLISEAEVGLSPSRYTDIFAIGEESPESRYFVKQKAAQKRREQGKQ